MEKLPRFLSDSPIGKDHFGRAKFARALAQALVLPRGSEGLVAGIEGSWGSGKSFVINQIPPIVNELDTSAIVVEFNPWIISGTDSLVEALLEQICSAIGMEVNPAKKKAALETSTTVLKYLSLVRHLKHLKYVPGVSAIGLAAEDLSEIAEKLGNAATESEETLSQLAKAIPDHNLFKRKLAASKALAALERPIIVILDDLDRLPPDEIRSVFQAVKAVANFPRTAYLLAYDPNIAARALDTDKEVGARYLEKIVQIQYPLPIPLPWRMHSFVLEKITSTLTELERKLSRDEEARFEETVSYVARLCHTPRDAIRICNRLRLSLPSTKHEVDACDVILLEAIAVCEPDVDKAIRLHPEDFTEPAQIDFEKFGNEFYFSQAFERSASKKQGDKEPNWRKHIKSGLSAYVEGAIRHLFPKEASRQTIRVQNWERLYRFLALGKSEFITEIGDIRELIADERTLKRALESGDESALSILRSIEVYLNELTIPDVTRTVKTLCATAAKRLLDDGDWDHLARQYCDTITAIIKTKTTSHKKLFELVVDTAPISISQELVTEAAINLGLGKDISNEFPSDNPLLNTNEYKSILTRWKKHVKARFLSGADFKREPRIYAALYRLGQLGGDYTLARSIGKKLVHDGDLHRFMRSTQLSGIGRTTVQILDIVWDNRQLVKFIKRDQENIDRYQEAIKILEGDVAMDYFTHRTKKPTKKWPP